MTIVKQRHSGTNVYCLITVHTKNKTLLTYVCTDRILDSPQFVYNKMFLKILLWKLVDNIFHIFNILSTLLAVRTTIVLPVQTVRIMKKNCVVLYILADKNKLISRNVYNDIPH